MSEVYEELRRIAARVAGEAAGYLRDNMGVEEVLEVEVKRSEDESMRIDIGSEKLIAELLEANGFKGVMVGEEQGARRINGGGDYVAVVDPLDGSKNYAAQIPWASVSIAIAPLNGDRAVLSDVVAGAVAPIAPGYPVYSFAKGGGAYEGGLRASPRPRPLSRMVMAYIEKPEQASILLKYLEAAGGRRAVRALGSASLEIVWAATGRAELFMDVRGKLRVVDVAAALGFARELRAKTYIGNPEASLLSGTSRAGSVVVTAFEDVWSRVKNILGV